jgi:tryptophanyl-tRNA synthetase
MTQNYANVNRDFGYGHAKQALFELIVERFKTERETYNHYMNNLPEIEAALLKGASKAQAIANGVLSRVREKLGFRG